MLKPILDTKTDIICLSPQVRIRPILSVLDDQEIDVQKDEVVHLMKYCPGKAAVNWFGHDWETNRIRLHWMAWY